MARTQAVEIPHRSPYEKRALQALDAVPPRLGPVVRAARNAEGLGVRELARRAGISEAQVSRVENEKTTNPSDGTLEGIANALGRSTLALVCLSDSPEATVFASSAREVLETLPSWLRARYDADQLEDFPPESPPPQLRQLARDVFLHQNLASMLETANIGPIFNDELLEIVTGWTGLTKERQHLCTQFMRDQLRLSELDRRDADRGRGKS